MWTWYHTCFHTCIDTKRIYIYIYIYANFIKHNRHFMSTYFLLDPFEFPYYFYRIRGELIYVLSIVVCIPITFCPTLDHHQGRIYYKSDVTFVLAYYYCVRASLPLKIIAFAFNCKQKVTSLFFAFKCKQKLHHFCNRSSPDDGPKSGRKYLGYIQLWTIHKSIPPEYDKSNTGIRTDPEENM